MSNYKHMANTYQKHTDMNLDSRAVMARLIGRLILNMKSAKEDHAKKRLEPMTEWNYQSQPV